MRPTSWSAITQRMSTSKDVVSRWHQRIYKLRLLGFNDEPRSCRPRTNLDEQVQKFGNQILQGKHRRCRPSECAAGIKPYLERSLSAPLIRCLSTGFMTSLGSTSTISIASNYCLDRRLGIKRSGPNGHRAQLGFTQAELRSHGQ